MNAVEIIDAICRDLRANHNHESDHIGRYLRIYPTGLENSRGGVFKKDDLARVLSYYRSVTR